jgi:hypothetical protein
MKHHNNNDTKPEGARSCNNSTKIIKPKNNCNKDSNNLQDKGGMGYLIVQPPYRAATYLKVTLHDHVNKDIDIDSAHNYNDNMMTAIEAVVRTA